MSDWIFDHEPWPHYFLDGALEVSARLLYVHPFITRKGNGSKTCNIKRRFPVLVVDVNSWLANHMSTRSACEARQTLTAGPRLAARFRTIQVYPKDLRALPGHPEPAVSWHSGFRGGAHARPQTTPVHHAARRRSRDMAARGTRAATVDTGDWFPGCHDRGRYSLSGIGIPRRPEGSRVHRRPQQSRCGSAPRGWGRARLPFPPSGATGICVRSSCVRLISSLPKKPNVACSCWRIRASPAPATSPIRSIAGCR